MTAPPRRDRPFDVVLFGATGFTGRLVAEWFAERHGASDARFALAGRDEGKLRALRAELVRRFGVPEWPLRVVDGFDRDGLAALARDTAVVCTTVGPYARYGADLVAACVEAGTDCCDLTAEVPFIRAMMDAHDARARETGARLVHCCGFDSIPSDLGTWMLQQAMRERHGGVLHEVVFTVGAIQGAFSGGTAASALGIAEAASRDRAVRKLLADPYGLDPPGAPAGPDGPGQRGVRFDADLAVWTAPFFMAPINTRVVRRTNALLGHAYGRDFRYREAMGTGSGPLGMLKACALTGGLAGFVLAASWGPTRRLLARVLPAPGEGPGAARREAGFFVMQLAGKGSAADGTPVELRGRIEGRHDPGYVETARMLGESALCLALDGPSPGFPGGSLTPAAAMGERLLERLRAAELVFEV